MGWFYARQDLFHGLGVVEILDTIDTTWDLLPEDMSDTAVHVTLDWDAPDGSGVGPLFSRLLAHPDIERLPGLLIGRWTTEAAVMGDSSEMVEAVIAAADQLPSLRHLFVGEVTSDEFEVSWLNHSDLSPLFDAYPQLESFHVRGSNGLTLGPVTHRHLKTLHVETGGLTSAILTQIAQSTLPELEELKVCIGTDEYGWDGGVDDINAFVDAVHERFPKLLRFGLQNMLDEETDAVAAYVATHPLLDRLTHLDLSLGVLTDAGAEALLSGGKLDSLAALDLYHNYLTDDMRARLSELPVEVNADRGTAYEDEYDGQTYRYNAIGE